MKFAGIDLFSATHLHDHYINCVLIFLLIIFGYWIVSFAFFLQFLSFLAYLSKKRESDSSHLISNDRQTENNKPCDRYDLWPLRILPSIVYVLRHSQVFSMLCSPLRRRFATAPCHLDFYPDAPKSIDFDIVSLWGRREFPVRFAAPRMDSNWSTSIQGATDDLFVVSMWAPSLLLRFAWPIQFGVCVSLCASTPVVRNRICIVSNRNWKTSNWFYLRIETLELIRARWTTRRHFCIPVSFHFSREPQICVYKDSASKTAIKWMKASIFLAFMHIIVGIRSKSGIWQLLQAHCECFSVVSFELSKWANVKSHSASSAQNTSSNQNK